MHCPYCNDQVNPKRWELGYQLCLTCGEHQAKQRKHTVVPLSKSNYIHVRDPQLLKQLNPKHTTWA